MKKTLRLIRAIFNTDDLMLFDDYTFKTCPGVKLAVDEFLLDKEENLICLTTQAFFIKR
jgi:hypothetical protein